MAYTTCPDRVLAQSDTTRHGKALVSPYRNRRQMFDGRREMLAEIGQTFRETHRKQGRKRSVNSWPEALHGPQRSVRYAPVRSAAAVVTRLGKGPPEGRARRSQFVDAAVRAPRGAAGARCLSPKIQTWERSFAAEGRARRSLFVEAAARGLHVGRRAHGVSVRRFRAKMRKF
ncbi:hypothetical protein Bbelb_418630 [Branchiostoma belcheri]|nr:hypothetical protein Bbelb_418630 [Branchiostoma belcheri]